VATKTIKVDVEAYNRLSRARQKGESFRQTIKRLLPIPVAPVPSNWDAWLKKLEANPASESFIRAVEEQLKNRRRPLSRRR
jgi:hypothetical protein